MMTDFDALNDEEGWEVYIVSMEDIETGVHIGPVWPVYAEDHEAAIEIYRLLYKISTN
jgi:hypothetical protein